MLIILKRGLKKPRGGQQTPRHQKLRLRTLVGLGRRIKEELGRRNSPRLKPILKLRKRRQRKLRRTASVTKPAIWLARWTRPSVSSDIECLLNLGADRSEISSNNPNAEEHTPVGVGEDGGLRVFVISILGLCALEHGARAQPAYAFEEAGRPDRGFDQDIRLDQSDSDRCRIVIAGHGRLERRSCSGSIASRPSASRI